MLYTLGIILKIFDLHVHNIVFIILTFLYDKLIFLAIASSRTSAVAKKGAKFLWKFILFLGEKQIYFLLH